MIQYHQSGKTLLFADGFLFLIEAASPAKSYLCANQCLQ